MKLVLDVMGNDNSPEYALIAAKKFKHKYPEVDFVIAGDKEKINDNTFEIIDTKNVVHTEESPASMLRNTESSMFKAISCVKEGNADGMITAGTTAAYVLLSNYIIKPIVGINKPGFMSYVPTSNGRGFMFLDVGANLHCTGDDLYKFAIMANIYCKEVLKKQNPSIGILNIGTEENKGLDYQQEANVLLKNNKDLNYTGFIESRELLDGKVDIVVCDGYTGNMVLKALEGSLLAINKLLKKEYKKPWNYLGALFSIGVIKKIKKNFDYKNHAGAFVVGLNKNIVKTHGNAKDQEWYSAIEMLYSAIKNNLVETIKKNFSI